MRKTRNAYVILFRIPHEKRLLEGSSMDGRLIKLMKIRFWQCELNWASVCDDCD
jgi:hypothetical protein